MSAQPFPALAAAVIAPLALGLAAPGLAQAPPTAASPAAGPATPVRPLTVQTEPPARPKVVASTDAAPLTSPDFTDKDAAPPPMAVIIAPNTAAGRITIPTGKPDGLLKANPELNRNGLAVDVGVTTVF
jgi:hypothetical protein